MPRYKVKFVAKAYFEEELEAADQEQAAEKLRERFALDFSWRPKPYEYEDDANITDVEEVS
jgi:hypothetical protein